MDAEKNPSRYYKGHDLRSICAMCKTQANCDRPEPTKNYCKWYKGLKYKKGTLTIQQWLNEIDEIKNGQLLSGNGKSAPTN